MQKKAERKIDGMSRELKLAYFSNGHVTVGTIAQVFDNRLKRFYVAKIRGVIVGNEDKYKHETPEAARAYGKEIQAKWRAEFTEITQRIDTAGGVRLRNVRAVGGCPTKRRNYGWNDFEC